MSRRYVEARLRIVQLRAENSERPLSIDTIIGRMSLEGWDPLPSRGSVANWVRQWDSRTPRLKEMERPFQWRDAVSGLPWEAAAWVLECARAFDTWAMILSGLSANGMPGLLLLAAVDQASRDQDWLESLARPMEEARSASASVPPFGIRVPNMFTNRWAQWSWRVHLAAPDLDAMEVLSLADVFLRREQVGELLDVHDDRQSAQWDAWLRFRPRANEKRDESEVDYYALARDAGMIERPDIASEFGHFLDAVPVLGTADVSPLGGPLAVAMSVVFLTTRFALYTRSLDAGAAASPGSPDDFEATSGSVAEGGSETSP